MANKATAVLKTEPVLTASAVLAVVFGVLGFLFSHGVLSDAQENLYKQLATTAVPFLLPLLTGLWVRAQVWAPFRWIENELVPTPQAAFAPADVSAFADPSLPNDTYSGSADLDVPESEPFPGADLDTDDDVPVEKAVIQ